MKVLFLTSGYWPDIGGIPTLAGSLIPDLTQRGFKFSIVTPGPRNSAAKECGYAEIHHLDLRDEPTYRNPAKLSELLAQLNIIISKFQPDLVHLNGLGHHLLLYLLSSRLRSLPMLLSIHGGWGSSEEANSLVVELFHRANWVTACSDWALEACQRVDPTLHQRSSLLYNALPDVGVTFSPTPTRDVVCAGRLTHEKGFDLALRAWSTLTKEFSPRHRLKLIGEGPERSTLERLAEKEDLGDSVVFMGALPPEKVREEVSRASLTLVPSRSEGFGLVALEAALRGRPVVAANVGGLPEVILHGETGVLSEPNPTALSQSIRWVLQEESLGESLGRRAREWAREKFSWTHYCDTHDLLYKRLKR